MNILVASAKPNDHRVIAHSVVEDNNGNLWFHRLGRNRTYVYGRIRKRTLSDDQCYVQLMTQVAKVTLRTVREICQNK